MFSNQIKVFRGFPQWCTTMVENRPEEYEILDLSGLCAVNTYFLFADRNRNCALAIFHPNWTVAVEKAIENVV